jgi:uncharacterized protein YecT (DUF1311 family)
VSPRALVAFVLALPMHAAQAAEDCSGLETQAAISACAAQALRQTEAELDEAYREAMARLAGDAAGKQALTRAARAWLAFRDADCAFVAAPAAGGSIQPMVMADCLAGLSRARLAQLRAWLACPEGDLTCPLPAGAP